MNLEDKICSLCGEIMGTTIADLDKSAMVVFQCVNPYCLANKKVKDNSNFPKKEKEFEILIENLSIAYNQFCLNRVIHEKVVDNFYSNFNRTWNIILWGLEMSYLLGLAKIFDKPKNISIYRFLDFDSQNEEIIEKLRKFRNKILVHSDAKKMLEKDKFVSELNFKTDRSDIESLFHELIEWADRINSEGNFKSRFEFERNDTRIKFSNWFEVFQKGIN